MRTLLPLLFITTLLGCRLGATDKNFKSMRVFKFVIDDKIITDDTVSHNMEVTIAYIGDMTMYEVPVIQLKTFGTEVDSGRLFKKLKPYDTTFNYYVVKNGFVNGLGYDSLDIKKPSVFRKDSLLKMINLDSASISFYGIDLGKPLTITKRKNIEIEKYGKILDTDPDSIYRYYDRNLNDLPFSFSPGLDKKKGMKLWKTVYIYQRSVDKNNKQKPRIESLTKIEELKVKNPNKYISLFKRYEEESKLIIGN